MSKNTVTDVTDAGNPTTETSTPEPADIAEPPQFERAMAELEALVERLEGDGLTLEESLAVFERGIGLTRACQHALDAAEQRVRILTESSGTAAPEPFGDGTRD